MYTFSHCDACHSLDSAVIDCDALCELPRESDSILYCSAACDTIPHSNFVLASTARLSG